jgi:hypothetical protein
MTEPPKPKIRHGSETRQRQFSVRVRLDDTERVQLTAKAAESGLSVPALIRYCALGSEGPRARRRPPVERELLARASADLNRVGNNLNQIARGLNQSALADWPDREGQSISEEVLRSVKEASAELLAVLAIIRRSLGYDSEG